MATKGKTMATANLKAARLNGARLKALKASAAALREAADYKLPRALQRKLQAMLQNKEFLSEATHQELLTIVEAVQLRTLEKAQAQAALRLLQDAFPELRG